MRHFHPRPYLNWWNSWGTRKSSRTMRVRPHVHHPASQWLPAAGEHMDRFARPCAHRAPAFEIASSARFGEGVRRPALDASGRCRCRGHLLHFPHPLGGCRNDARAARARDRAHGDSPSNGQPRSCSIISLAKAADDSIICAGQTNELGKPASRRHNSASRCAPCAVNVWRSSTASRRRMPMP